MGGHNARIGGGGFHHVAMRVRDFDASWQFYTEGLGFVPRVTWGEGDGRAAMLDTGAGNYLEIFAGGSDEPRPEGTVLHFALRTADCDKAIEAARAAGAEVTVEPRDVTIPSDPPTPVRLAFCKGPVGRLDAEGNPIPYDKPALVRVHSECLTGDVFGSLRCDCGPQLRAALAAIETEGAGALVYVRQEGRGIGLINKLRAYRLQIEKGLDTVDANLHLGFEPDRRDYGIGSQILRDLGLRQLRVMTNNPRKIYGLEGFGLHIVERVPLQIPAHDLNRDYLRAKKDRLGHLLDDV